MSMNNVLATSKLKWGNGLVRYCILSALVYDSEFWVINIEVEITGNVNAQKNDEGIRNEDILVRVNEEPKLIKMIKETANILAPYISQSNISVNAYFWKAQSMAREEVEDQGTPGLQYGFKYDLDCSTTHSKFDLTGI